MCEAHPKLSGLTGREKRRGFTLIEILIVVVILGILASVVVPQLSGASHLTRENTLKDDLRYLRMQITVFKAQHRDVPPGYPDGNIAGGATFDAFLAQMTGCTDEQCHVGASSATYRFGPYLQKMPPNPLNDLSTVLIVQAGQAIPAPTGENGWIYKPSTQEIMPDLTGTDSDAKPYSSY